MLVYEAVHPAVLARLPPRSARPLDLGCGDGSLGAVWAQQGPDAIACDPARILLAVRPA